MPRLFPFFTVYRIGEFRNPRSPRATTDKKNSHSSYILPIAGLIFHQLKRSELIIIFKRSCTGSLTNQFSCKL